MTFEWHLFEIGINVFQGWLYCYFLNNRMMLKPGIDKTRHKLATIATIMAVASFYSLYIWYEVPVSDFMAWGFTLIYSLVEFSERWHVKVAWNACLAVLMLGVINLCSMLLIQVTGTTWEIIMQPTSFRIIYVLSSNLMALLVMYVLAKVKPRQTLVSWGALFVFILMNVALVIGLEMQYQLSWENIVYEQQMLITMACIIFVSACTIILFELLSSKTEQTVKLETQIENDRMLKVYNEELQAMYKELMEHQHDMKHQFCVLEELIAHGEVAESQRYLDRLRERVLPVRYRTGCISVDAILTVKAMHMRSVGVRFEFESYPLIELPIDAQDFCAVIGNLLDNAVEASVGVERSDPERIVKLKIERIRDMLYVTCENSADVEKIRRRGNELISLKRVDRPGYGIASIRRIVDRAEGFFSFISDERSVTVEVILPYERRE